MKYADSFDENVDLVGLGAANLAAGISGTFVVNGSPTKTEMVDSAGGRSQISQLTAAAIVVVVLLFLTVPLGYMPNAVLAAVVFIIGLRLVDAKGMADIYRLRKGEFVVAAITAATVVIVGVEQGIILAIFISILEHIHHSYRPHDTLMARADDGAIHTAPLADGTQLLPGLAAYRFGASLYYANSARFTEEIMELVGPRGSAAALGGGRRIGHRRHRLFRRRCHAPGPRGARRPPGDPGAGGHGSRHPEAARRLRADRPDRTRPHLRFHRRRRRGLRSDSIHQGPHRRPAMPRHRRPATPRPGPDSGPGWHADPLLVP